MQQPTSGMSQPSVSTMQLRDELDLAGCQPRQRGIAFGLRRRAVDVLGAHAGVDEFVAQVDGVRDVDGEGDGLSPLAVFVPVRDDVADQLRPIHALGELAFDIVAACDCARLSDRD